MSFLFKRLIGKSRFKAKLLTFAVIFIYLGYTCYRLLNAEYANLNTRNEKEIYATLLCPSSPHPVSQGEIDYYYEGTRILTYRLLHKLSTKDVDNRRLIVLATESVLPEQIRQLRTDGAIVKIVRAIQPPKGVDTQKTKARWKDQYTKLVLWNMTQYSKILYIDSDILPIRPLSPIFNMTFSIDKDGHPYLFAATYDSSVTRTFGTYRRPVPALGLNDTQAGDSPHAGLFLIHPSERQANYLQSLYDNPPKNQDFTSFMEQSMLKYAYRNGGDYQWTRLSQMYNTQWPRLEDTNVSYAIHDKFWRDRSPVAWNLRRFWYVAWGEMQGWSETRQKS